MTALWISIAAAAVALLVWRLQRANQVLNGILREEHDITERGTTEPEVGSDHPVEQRER